MENTQPIKNLQKINSDPSVRMPSVPNQPPSPLNRMHQARETGSLPCPPEEISQDMAKALSRHFKNRRIFYLTHFTRLENLTSILKNGLLSRAAMKSDSKFAAVKFNEPQLPSAWQWAVSLNISFPNYRLFYKLQERSGYDWIVLLFDINLLLDQPFYYFPYPAASLIHTPHFQKAISPYLQHLQSFEKLFTDTENVQRSMLEIPDSYPTNPQSEVLTFSPVSMQALREVHFFNDYKFNQWFLQNTDLVLSIDKKLWHTGLTYFSPRCDYIHWKSKLIR